MTLALTCDLGTHTRPRYYDDLHPHQNGVNSSTDSKVISKKQEIAIFYCYDLDLEPITLILKLDLDIMVVTVRLSL